MIFNQYKDHYWCVRDNCKSKILAFQNLFNIVLQASVTGIICVGVAKILITGEFDLSVGPQISILGLVMTITVSRTIIFLIIVLVILLGMAIGALNDFFVIRVRVQSFIITLALAAAYRWVGLLISGGKSLSLQARFKLFIGKFLNVVPYRTIVFIIALIKILTALRYVKFGRILFEIDGNVWREVVLDNIMLLAVFTSGLAIKD